MRKFHRSLHRRGPRRRLEWGRTFAGGPVDGTVTAGTELPFAYWAKVPAGVLNTRVLPDGAPEPEDWTLVRSIHALDMVCVVADPSVTMFNMSAGVLVWNGIDDSLPAVGTYPSPTVQGDFDWVWRISAVGAKQVASANTVFNASTSGASELLIQSRAQRKLSAGAGLLFVVELSNQLGSGSSINGFAFNYDMRALFKLP